MKNNRLINILYAINYGWFFITVVLYITIYLGLFAQVALGGIQVVSSLLIIYYWSALEKKEKEKLINYWVIATVYLLLFWFLDWNSFKGLFLAVLGIVIVPIGIAIYFLTILWSVKGTMKSKQIKIIEVV